MTYYNLDKKKVFHRYAFVYGFQEYQMKQIPLNTKSKKMVFLLYGFVCVHLDDSSESRICQTEYS